MLGSRPLLLLLALVMGCVPMQCRPEQPGQGERCVFTSDGGAPYTTPCRDDLACDSAGTGHCVEPGTEAPQCEVMDDCAADEWCDYRFGCKPRREAGEACEYPQQCLSDRCDASLGVCTAAP